MKMDTLEQVNFQDVIDQFAALQSRKAHICIVMVIIFKIVVVILIKHFNI